LLCGLGPLLPEGVIVPVHLIETLSYFYHSFRRGFSRSSLFVDDVIL